MIHIYYSYLSKENHKNLLEKKLVDLPYGFQERIKRYRRWQDAQSSILGRVLLFESIKDVYNKDFRNKKIEYTKYNKPFFYDDSIYFNISHSGELVVCAISDSVEIGIDIEIISSIKTEDFREQFTEREWNKINLFDDNRINFFDCWTRKEAILKSYGCGLVIPLKSFDVIENEVIINGEKFYLKEINIDKSYKCYISSKTRIDDIHLKNSTNIIKQ